MAVGVKILLACLLATHVASQVVLANSVLAQQYPQEMNILQASGQGMMYSSTVVLYVSVHQFIDKHCRFSFLQDVQTFRLKMGVLLIVNPIPIPLLVIGQIELWLSSAVTWAMLCFTIKPECAWNLESGVAITHLVWVNTFPLLNAYGSVN